MSLSLRLAALAVLLALTTNCSKSPAEAGTQLVARRAALEQGLAIAADTTTPTVGGAVAVRISAPVHNDAALIGQTLEASFDKTRVTLTGAPVFPQGWTTTYYADGGALPTAPSTLAAWSRVDRVVTSGTVESDGSAQGQQVISGLADGTVQAPPTATTFSGGSAGDGWDVFFSPDRTRVFNIHHHNGPPTVMCRKSADGSSCGTGFPFSLYNTGNRSMG